jgi:hypothetical protein
VRPSLLLLEVGMHASERLNFQVAEFARIQFLNRLALKTEFWRIQLPENPSLDGMLKPALR